MQKKKNNNLSFMNIMKKYNEKIKLQLKQIIQIKMEKNHNIIIIVNSTRNKYYFLK